MGSGLRPRSRADGCRLAASTSVCGSPERAADGLGGAPGALKRARDVAGGLSGREDRRGLTSGSRSLGGAPGSHPITDAYGLVRGHPGIELRRCRPLDPLRCDSAPKPSVLATGEISPASFPVSAAGWPTRRPACSFSPAVSLGDDGPFARVARPALSAVLSWLLPPPTAGPSRGTSRRHAHVFAFVVSGHAVGLVDDDQVPLARLEALEHLVVPGEVVHAGDEQVPLSEGIAALARLDGLAANQLEAQGELLGEFVLPLGD